MRLASLRARLPWIVAALALSTVAADTAVMASRQVPVPRMPISVAVEENLVKEDEAVAAERKRERDEAVRAMFRRRAEAVTKRDRTAFLADVYRGDGEFLARQEQVFDSLGKLDFGSWEYRLTDETYSLSNLDWRKYAQADDISLPVLTLHYRLKDFDRKPVVRRVVYTVVRRGSRWLIANDRDLQDSTSSGTSVRRDPWENGPITVRRNANGLVIGHPDDVDAIDAIQREVESAVKHVSSFVGKKWGEKTVVILPADHEELEYLLENPDVPYEFAAIARPEYTELDPDDPSQFAGSRVVIEPDNFDPSASFNRLLIRHEITHVATFERTGPLTPRWLVEGLAEWVGNAGSDLPTQRLAPAFAELVSDEGVPDYLPLDSDFGIIGDASIGYDGGWLLCRYIASRWGRDALIRFFDGMGTRQGLNRPGEKLDTVLRSVLRTDEKALLAGWRPFVLAAVGEPSDLLSAPDEPYDEIDVGTMPVPTVARQHDVKYDALKKAAVERAAVGLWTIGDEESPDRMVTNLAVVSRDEAGAKAVPALLTTPYRSFDLGTAIPNGRLYRISSIFEGRTYDTAVAVVRVGIVTHEIRVSFIRGNPAPYARALAAEQVAWTVDA